MKTLVRHLVWGLAGVMAAAGPAMAQGPGMGSRFGQHRPPIESALGLAGGQFWNNPDTAKALNLTDDQRKAMDGILQDHRMKLIDQQATLRKAEVAMIPLMKADSPDRGAIEAQIDKVVAARADLEKANARFLLDIRLQLKPDQWKQLQAIHAERMRERGREGWRPGGPGPGMGGPGSRFQRQGPPPAGGAPQAAPTAPPSGGGDQ